MFTRRHLQVLLASLVGLFASVSAVEDHVEHIHLNLAEGRRNLQDSCNDAILRSANGQFNAESTIGRPQSTGLGTCNGLSSEVGPGVWFAVSGTGSTIKASTCNENTEFKATLLVFSGSTFDCTSGQLTCVQASDDTDFECVNGQTRSTAVEWKSIAGQTYYVLVQSQIPGNDGTVWMNFRTISAPANDECKSAIGPIPPVELQLDGTTSDATITAMPNYCGPNQLYPGVWYSFFGSGSDMIISACGNSDASYAFSLYKGPNCDSLTCELSSATYSVTKITGDQSKCLFQNPDESLAVRELNELRFLSKFEQRYFLYVAHDPTSNSGPLTGSFRLFLKSVEDPPTFPPVEVPTRAPSSSPSQNPTPHGVTAFPTRSPTAIPMPSNPTIIPLQTAAPITGTSAAPNETRSILVCLVVSVGALFLNDLW